MRRLLCAAAGTLLALAAAGAGASEAGPRRVLLNAAAPSWVLPGAGLDFDFANGRYYQAASGGRDPSSLVAMSRASVGTDLLPNSAPGAAFRAFANNTPRITPGSGLLVEEARTNLFLNSTAPATQTITLGATGTYTAWVNGTGSLAIAAGTATGSGFGTATNGSPVTFTISGAGTITCTKTGSLNAAQVELGGFGTSFIPTTGASATRAADAATAARPPVFGNAYTLFAGGTPNAPTSYGVLQNILQLDDGSVNNEIALGRFLNTGDAGGVNVSGGAGAFLFPNVVWSGFAKIAASTAAGAQALSFDGGTPATGAGALPLGAGTLNIGTNQAGLQQFDGYIARVAAWPNAAQPHAFLQGITQ